VQDLYFYDYAVIRVVPRVEREEFVNAGVILSCPEQKFLKALIELDEKKVNVLDPSLDIETTKSHLASIKEICEGGKEAGALGKLSKRERFHLLTSPKSTIIQTSPVHSGYCTDPFKELEHLVKKMVGSSSKL
jgi:hypothetical protein